MEELKRRKHERAVEGTSKEERQRKRIELHVGVLPAVGGITRMEEQEPPLTGSAATIHLFTVQLRIHLPLT